MNHRVYNQAIGHAVAEEAIHEDGVYGEVGRVVHSADALAIGCTLGTVLKSKKLRLVIVGRDNRNSSAVLEDEICRGLAASGSYVMRAGVAPSPALQFSAHCLGAASIMVTGSNGSSDINGFYICLQQCPVYGSQLARIIALSANGGWDKGRGGVVDSNILEAYIKKLQQYTKRKRKLKIVWDLCGGTACTVIPKLSNEISGEHLLMNDELDPFFGEQLPSSFDAERQEILCEVINEEKCDLGIILNADSRQVVMADDSGHVWSTEELFCLLLQNMPKNTDAKKVAVLPVDCPMFVRQVAKELGIEIFFAHTEFGSIIEKIHESSATLGFSQDGRIAFGAAYNFAPFDDGIFTALTLINILNSGTTALSGLKKKFRHEEAQPKMFRHAEPDEVIQAVRRRLLQQNRTMYDLYGIRCDLDEGWWRLRREGEYLVLDASATNAQDLDYVSKDAEHIISLISSEIAQPEEVAESVIPVQKETGTEDKKHTLKDISDDDRENIDFASKHWKSIRRSKKAEENKENPEQKRPWSRRSID